MEVPSKDSPVRWSVDEPAVPSIRITSALPLAHPARLTTAWISALMSGVLWPVPAWPTVGHAGIAVHDTDPTLVRDVMLLAAVVNVGALSIAWA